MPHVQVRLVDINPIGGTTSALLFDWAELPYALGTASAAKGADEGPPSGEAAAQPPISAGRSSSDVRGAASASGPCVANHTPASSGCTRGVTDAWENGSGGHRAAGGTCTRGTANTSGSEYVSHSSSGGGLGGAGPGDGMGHPQFRQGAGGDLLGVEIEFRVVTEPEGIRPSPAACRAPYDFADTGPGGAVDELLRKLQLEPR